MMKHDYSITFACYNQLDYTRRCIDSLVSTGTDLSRVVAVDNGSRDGTIEYLTSLPLGDVVLNKQNLGCGVAWNQGVLAQQAEWSIIMNNDIVCSAGWLDGLIDTAQAHNLKIVSPGMVEGALDYDFASLAGDARIKMKDVLRPGVPHAVCMAVHSSVWMDIGYFMSIPKLFGYEDGIFFSFARRAGIRMATTGSSWIHHFGSITQKAMKMEQAERDNKGLGDRKLCKSIIGDSWLERKKTKIAMERNRNAWNTAEFGTYGMTLHGIRTVSGFNWQI